MLISSLFHCVLYTYKDINIDIFINVLGSYYITKRTFIIQCWKRGSLLITKIAILFNLIYYQVTNKNNDDIQSFYFNKETVRNLRTFIILANLCFLFFLLSKFFRSFYGIKPNLFDFVPQMNKVGISYHSLNNLRNNKIPITSYYKSV